MWCCMWCCVRGDSPAADEDIAMEALSSAAMTPAGQDAATEYLYTTREVVDATMGVAGRPREELDAIQRCHDQLLKAPLAYAGQVLATRRANALLLRSQRVDLVQLSGLRLEMCSLLDTVGTRVARARDQARPLAAGAHHSPWPSSERFLHPIMGARNVLRAHEQLQQEVQQLERARPPGRGKASSIGAILSAAYALLDNPDPSAPDLCLQFDGQRMMLRNALRLQALRAVGPGNWALK